MDGHAHSRGHGELSPTPALNPSLSLNSVKACHFITQPTSTSLLRTPLVNTRAFPPTPLLFHRLPKPASSEEPIPPEVTRDLNYPLNEAVDGYQKLSLTAHSV